MRFPIAFYVGISVTICLLAGEKLISSLRKHSNLYQIFAEIFFLLSGLAAFFANLFLQFEIYENYVETCFLGFKLFVIVALFLAMGDRHLELKKEGVSNLKILIYWVGMITSVGIWIYVFVSN